MKLAKRVLAVVLAVLLAFGNFSTVAFAASGEPSVPVATEVSDTEPAGAPAGGSDVQSPDETVETQENDDAAAAPIPEADVSMSGDISAESGTEPQEGTEEAAAETSVQESSEDSVEVNNNSQAAETENEAEDDAEEVPEEVPAAPEGDKDEDVTPPTLNEQPGVEEPVAGTATVTFKVMKDGAPIDDIEKDYDIAALITEDDLPDELKQMRDLEGYELEFFLDEAHTIVRDLEQLPYPVSEDVTLYVVAEKAEAEPEVVETEAAPEAAEEPAEDPAEEPADEGEAAQVTVKFVVFPVKGTEGVGWTLERAYADGAAVEMPAAADFAGFPEELVLGGWYLDEAMTQSTLDYTAVAAEGAVFYAIAIDPATEYSIATMANPSVVYVGQTITVSDPYGPDRLEYNWSQSGMGKVQIDGNSKSVQVTGITAGKVTLEVHGLWGAGLKYINLDVIDPLVTFDFTLTNCTVTDGAYYSQTLPRPNPDDFWLNGTTYYANPFSTGTPTGVSFTVSPNEGYVITSASYSAPGVGNNAKVPDDGHGGAIFEYSASDYGSYTISHTVVASKPTMGLTITARDDGELMVGSSVPLTVTITTDSSEAFRPFTKTPSDVTVTIGGQEYTVNNLTDNKDGTWSGTIDYVIQPGDGGEIEATASASVKYSGTVGVTVNNTRDTGTLKSEITVQQEAKTTFTVQTVGLSVTKTADKPTPALGETVTYTIKVKNTGTLPLKNVRVTDTPDWADAKNWTIESLAAGEEETFTTSVKVDKEFVRAHSGATLTNTVTAKGVTEGGKNPPDATATATITVPKARYTVTYQWNEEKAPEGQSVPEQETYLVGDSVTPASVEVPVDKCDQYGNLLERYTFSGWYNGKAKAESTFEMPPEDVILTGTWNKETHKASEYQHTVTYSVSGDIPEGYTAPVAQTYSKGQTYTVEAAPDAGEYTVTDDYGNVLKQYTFEGWKDANDIIHTPNTPDLKVEQTMGDANVVYTGVWTRTVNKTEEDYQHTVTYSVSGDIPEGYTAPETKTYSEGQTYKVEAVPNAAGYTEKDSFGNVLKEYSFSGWNDPNNGTMGDADVTITGSWTRNVTPVESYTGSVPVKYHFEDDRDYSDLGNEETYPTSKSGPYGSSVTFEPVGKVEFNQKHYALDRENSTLTRKVARPGEKQEALEVYYALDANQDGTPDKYQKVTIVITGNSDVFPYNGTTQKVDGFTYTATLDDGSDVHGLVSVTSEKAHAEGKDANTYPMELTADDFTVDSGKFELAEPIQVNDGILTINKLAATVKSASAEKEYDGDALTATEVTGEGFVDGEGVTGTATGSQTLVGSSANPFTYEANEGTNLDNYTITETKGTLTVKERTEKYEITVKANGGTAVYDGADHSVSGFESLTFEVEGNTYTVSGLEASASGKDAGTYDSKVTGTAVVTDADGIDVTEQFTVKTEDGKLTINKKPLLVVIDGETVTADYDGGAHNASYMVTVPGDKAYSRHDFETQYGWSFNTSGMPAVEGIDAGEYELDLQAITFTPVEADHEIAKNYEVTVQRVNDGSLTISPAKVTVTAEITVDYTGEAQDVTVTEENVTGSVGFVLEDRVDSLKHTISVTGPEPSTESIENDDIQHITVGHNSDGGKKDNRRNYDITLNVTVKFRSQFTVSAQNVVYNGRAQTTDVVIKDAVTGQVLDNSGFYISYKDNTNAGTASVTVSPKAGAMNGIYSETVTGYFQISKAPLTVKAGDASKTYGDADPAFGYTVSGLVGSDTADLVKGVQFDREPGEDVGSYAITPRDADELQNYTVSYEQGTLTITKKSVGPDAGITVTAPESVVYNGQAQEQKPVVMDGEKTLEEGVDYELSYSDNVDAGTANVTVTFTGNYEGTASTSFQITKRSVTLTSADASKQYDGEPLTNDEVTVGGEGFAEGEGAAYTVTGSQTVVGSSANEFTYQLNGNTKEDNYTIEKFEGTLEVTPKAFDENSGITVTAPENVVYNGEVQKLKPVVMDGETVLQEGVDYELSYEGDTVNVGTVTVTVTFQGNYSGAVTRTYEITKRPVTLRSRDNSWIYNGQPHVWKYVDDVTEDKENGGLVEGETFTFTFADSASITDHGSQVNAYSISDGTAKMSNYDITQNEGTLTVTKRPVTLASEDGIWTYDGQPHDQPVVKDVTEDKVHGGLVKGEEFDYTDFVTITNYGSTGNTYTISDSTAKADNYDITKIEGTLTITKRAVTLRSQDMNWTYDGQAHVWDKVDVVGGNGIVPGESFHYENFPSITNVSQSGMINRYTVTAGDHTDLKNYSITYQQGTLTITPRAATVKSASAEKEYDGDALTAPEVTGEGFVEGEGVTGTAAGSQTLVGSSANPFTYQLNENTKAENYEITDVEGTLTVTDRTEKYEITVKANSDDAPIYDGRDHGVSGFESLTFEVAGHTYTVSGLEASASGKDAGTYDSKVTGTAVVTDAAGSDVTAQFTVKTEDGKLTINKKAATVTSASARKTYDGDALTASEVTCEGFVDGEGVTGTATGSQTVPGSSKNLFTYEANEGTKLDNYTITEIQGDLIVDPVEAAVTVKYVEEGSESNELRDPASVPTNKTGRYELDIPEELVKDGDHYVLVDDIPASGETLKDIEITVHYAKDNKGGINENGEETWDGIPDSQQFFVVYRTEEERKGSVTDAGYHTFSMEDNAEGFIASSSASGNSYAGGYYTFTSWDMNDTTLDESSVLAYELAPVGGETYTFTAHFQWIPYSVAPTATPAPSTQPTATPAPSETTTPAPSETTSPEPTTQPSASPAPVTPTAAPTARPSASPAPVTPTAAPTARPDTTPAPATPVPATPAPVVPDTPDTPDAPDAPDTPDAPVVTPAPVTPDTPVVPGPVAPNAPVATPAPTASPAPTAPNGEPVDGPDTINDLPDDQQPDEPTEIDPDDVPLADVPDVPDDEREAPPEPELVLDEEVLIDEDETPLASFHECCILHLIIMLGAFAVTLYYTHDRKKHQKREFELRSEL